MKALSVKWRLGLGLVVAAGLGHIETGYPAELSKIFPISRGSTMADSTLPRYTKLPLFNPHRKDFTCVYQDQHLPPIDPQAELWFEQALALDDQNIYYKDRNWTRIYQLYLQAAEHGHWRAMLNLAALILNRDYAIPEHDPEAAIRWVEKAMQLGVPDAWDTMGTYHQNGLVRGGDATSAYAFFQKAADMGSPSAQVFLGEALDAGWDNPGHGFWANQLIAQKMLQCALAQGDGNAVDQLSFDYSRIGESKDGTPEGKRRALEVLQEGVKVGSAKATNKLSTEFSGYNLSTGDNIVGYTDKEREKRYSKLGDALEFYDGRLKLPNLDKVLPLPPAPLPKWDGNIQTLLDAAKPVVLPAKPTEQELREYLAAQVKAGMIRQLAAAPSAPLISSGAKPSPQTGIWEGRVAADHPLAKVYNQWYRQAYVEKGNDFPDPHAQYLDIDPHDVRWTWLGSPNTLRAPGTYDIAF